MLDRLGPERRRLRPTGLTAGVTGRWPSLIDSTTLFSVFHGASFAGLRFKALLHVHFAEQLMYVGAPKSLVAWHIAAVSRLAAGDPIVAQLERAYNLYTER